MIWDNIWLLFDVSVFIIFCFYISNKYYLSIIIKVCDLVICNSVNLNLDGRWRVNNDFVGSFEIIDRKTDMEIFNQKSYNQGHSNFILCLFIYSLTIKENK